jgi:ubiquinol-cytochrome c reductase cytochrome c subunit
MKKRMLIPLGIVALSSIGGTFAISSGSAMADTDPTGAAVIMPTSIKATNPPAVAPSGVKNAGNANSTIRHYKNGQLLAYGNSAIIYRAPSSKLVSLGSKLYALNCASCHGVEANGVAADGSSAYPALVGLGPATIDFWISSGRMPAANPGEIQAVRKPAKLDAHQSEAIASWINSLEPTTPYLPQVNVKGADLANGNELFALNCAACHTITGGGDALAHGTIAPSLHPVPANQVVEAIRTGPGNMPVFTGNLTDAQVRDITTYVTTTLQNPATTGGANLGGLGPVAEGLIALALGVGILALIAFWIGDRT